MKQPPYKALIVDDERLARKGLMSQLESISDIEIVGEADDVPSAIKAIESLLPDILFLDIQMPGQSGFDLLEQINFDGKVIFITAYDEYALRAFEINALDYLMKPIQMERLKKSIERINLPSKKIAKEDEQTKLNYNDRLFIQLGTKIQFLKISEIVLIQSDGDYTSVYLSDKSKGLITKTMKEWEERLPENHFIRIHRTSIINTDYIMEIEKWFNYTYRVKLIGIEEPVIISRRYAKKLKETFL